MGVRDVGRGGGGGGGLDALEHAASASSPFGVGGGGDADGRGNHASSSGNSGGAARQGRGHAEHQQHQLHHLQYQQHHQQHHQDQEPSDAALMLQLQHGMPPFPQAVAGMGQAHHGGVDLSAFQQQLQQQQQQQQQQQKVAKNGNGEDSASALQQQKKRTGKRKSVSSGRTTVIVNHDASRKRDTTLGDGESFRVVKGRFSEEEKRNLFRLIREDEGLFHSFLHQRKERMYGTKSWMHEITRRYNEHTEKKRSLEAVRHHLMFRRIPAQPGGKQSTDDMLQEHATSCESPGTCTKCLIFQRVCVQNGLARCGYVECTDCKPELAHVDNFVILNPEDAPKRMQRQAGAHSSSSSMIGNGMGIHGHRGAAAAAAAAAASHPSASGLFRSHGDHSNTATQILQQAAFINSGGSIHGMPGFDAHENSSDSTVPISDPNATPPMHGEDAFGLGAAGNPYNRQKQHLKHMLPNYMQGFNNMFQGFTSGGGHHAAAAAAAAAAANGAASQKFLGNPGSSPSPSQRRFDPMAALESSGGHGAAARSFAPGALNTLLQGESATLSDTTQSNSSTPSHIALQMQGLASSSGGPSKKRRTASAASHDRRAGMHQQQRSRFDSSELAQQGLRHHQQPSHQAEHQDYFHYSNPQFQQHQQHQQHAQYQGSGHGASQFSPYQHQFQTANRSSSGQLQAPPPPPPVSNLQRNANGLPNVLDWQTS